MMAVHLWLCCGHMTKPNQAPVGGGVGGTCNNPLIYCSFKPQLFNNQILTRAFVQMQYENKAQTQTCADTDAATGIC